MTSIPEDVVTAVGIVGRTIPTLGTESAPPMKAGAIDGGHIILILGIDGKISSSVVLENPEHLTPKVVVSPA